MRRLNDVLAGIRKPGSRGWAHLIMLAVAGLGVWSYFAKLDEVVVAEGEVVPQGQVKTVQHLEGGIIQHIYVDEGDQVAAGDPLLRLDTLASEANREELSAKLDALLLSRERLAAEAVGQEPKFDPELVKRRPRFAKAEADQFASRQRELSSVLGSLNEKARQREQELSQRRTREETVTRDLNIARRELDSSTKLLNDRLTTMTEHSRIEREVERLQGELEEARSAIPQAEAALEEARQLLRIETVRMRRRASDELSMVEADIAQLRELLTRAADKVRRTVIRSPIAGVVKNRRYHTIGGVVQPGEGLMEIVPVGGTLVIEAKLSPLDVGYVRPQQRASIKVSAYDFIRYGSLEGYVKDISPDSHHDKDGVPYFKLLVETDKAYLGEREGELPIISGMVVTVDVTTGKKSVLQYLIQPLLKLRSEAFRER